LQAFPWGDVKMKAGPWHDMEGGMIMSQFKQIFGMRGISPHFFGVINLAGIETAITFMGVVAEQ
jgi:hypothetical protein